MLLLFLSLGEYGVKCRGMSGGSGSCYSLLLLARNRRTRRRCWGVVLDRSRLLGKGTPRSLEWMVSIFHEGEFRHPERMAARGGWHFKRRCRRPLWRRCLDFLAVGMQTDISRSARRGPASEQPHHTAQTRCGWLCKFLLASGVLLRHWLLRVLVEAGTTPRGAFRSTASARWERLDKVCGKIVASFWRFCDGMAANRSASTGVDPPVGSAALGPIRS